MSWPILKMTLKINKTFIVETYGWIAEITLAMLIIKEIMIL